MNAAHDPAYLKRRLARLRDEALLAAQTAQNGYPGDRNNSRVHLFAREAAMEVVKNAVLRMARLAHEITGDHSPETTAVVETEASALANAYIGWLNTTARRSPFPHMLPPAAQLQGKLNDAVAAMVDDFRNGIAGDNRMTKDPVVSVINNVTASPNAVVQNAIGTGNMQSVNQSDLRAAIQQMFASPEFKNLSEQQRKGIEDVADIVTEEAAKKEPDAGKLARWGQRLIGLLQDVGLSVAADIISKVLTGG